ncbi:MAG: hypothetical protein ACOZNI_02525 [Myxococcota bacterium]
MLRRLAPVVALLCLAAGAPDGASARLDELIGAAGYDDARLKDLAAERPELVWQLIDPRSRAALDAILALPPAEIRRVRDGQTIVRPPPEWSEKEAARVRALADALGVKYAQVRALTVRTRDAQLVRVELEVKRETAAVDLAWPPGWARQDAIAAVEAWSGRKIEAGPRSPLIDPSFENPNTVGVAWIAQPSRHGEVARDEARAFEGRASLRLAQGVAGPDGTVVTQRVGVRAGDPVHAVARAAADGLRDDRAGMELVFLDARGHALPGPDPASVDPTAQGWQSLAVAGTAPPETADAFLLLGTWGAGAVNFDDVRLAVGDGEPAGVATWSVASHGHVRVRVDPARFPDPSAAAARLDQALKAGATRAGVTPADTVTVYLFADAAHRDAVGARAPDVARGACWEVADSPWAAACPLRVMIQRAWGPPGNRFVAEGLSLALAGSGTDLDAEARGVLATLPPVATLAARYDASPAHRAAAASFAGWLLATHGNAATKAAWTTKDLAALPIPDVDAAWRKAVLR